jgi:hypothetical protein
VAPELRKERTTCGLRASPFQAAGNVRIHVLRLSPTGNANACLPLEEPLFMQCIYSNRVGIQERQNA